MDPSEWEEILNAWGLAFRRTREELAIAGSPERCLFRIGIEDGSGDRFVLERIAPQQHSRRNNIGQVLNTLRERGQRRIQAYLADTKGAYVTRYGDELWQISPYREGVPLQRPGYIDDGWRGGLLADFLVNLKRAASPGLPLGDRQPFLIMAFIDDLAERLRRNDPAVLEETTEIIRFLRREFGEMHDRLPVIFCHGDLHPVNVIWSATDIHCVIDWEFMGYKPEFYDAANLIGCIGMENPRGLRGALVHDFLYGLKRAGFLSPAGRRFLVEAVIALRFAWLSEWLRNGDREMVGLEVVYLKLLREHADALREAWDLPAN